MRSSKALAKIRSGRCARVAGLGHYLPFFIRYAAHFNYDVIWLDLEHRAMDPRDIQSLLALCHHNDIDCMVRPPTTERTKLYRHLEDGATGFMVPFVDDADIARHLVQATKFPPFGNRGIDGAGIDGDYGIQVWHPHSTYTEDANRETFITVQIETAKALDNLEQIAAVDGIDVLFVGPADLGTRLGLAGGKSLDEAIRYVAATAKRHNKAWGIPAADGQTAARYREMGAQLIAYGGDFALCKVLEESQKELDQAVGH